VPSRRFPGWPDDTSSPGLLSPYDTVPGRWIRVSAADPSATRCHVRGLDTSCATFSSGPPDACASERPWAYPFKGFPSLQSVPLSGPLPSCHYPRHTSLKERRVTMQPASGPCSCNESVLSPESNDSGRRSLPGFRPSRACSHPTWRSLSIATPPLAPFGGLTSRSTWASGYCGTNGWVDPSPDRQLSWASLPSDDHSAPFIVPQGGRMALPHARPHADGGDGRSMPLVRDATTDPGPVARHRRQSVCDR
jgi:hypothetical protein